MTVLEICVDAGLAIKTVVKESDSGLAVSLFEDWNARGVRLIAPPFFQVEADSILRQKLILRHEISDDDCESAFSDMQHVPIELVTLPHYRERAWQIAQQFGMPTVYDATYLALADMRDCEFWTADQKLYKLVRDELTFVHYLHEWEPGSGD